MSKENDLTNEFNEVSENIDEKVALNIDTDNSGIQRMDIEEDTSGLMGWFIRDKSFEGQVCNAEEFLEEPFSLDIDEILENIEELKTREDFKDIYTIKSESAIFLFSEKYITHNYADMLVMVEERDLLKLIADNVRNESKLYPRPTPAKLFSFAPFNLSKEQVSDVLEELKKKEDYMDIKETKTSNGALYLYSEEFMKRGHAASLAEWVEVGRKQNP